MEPFIVSCVACQSRIRVRNAKLVGQNVKCPKCGANVIVDAPAPPRIQIVDNPALQVDSTALTKEGLTGSFGSYEGSSQLAASAQDGDSPFSSFDFSEVEEAISQQAQHPTDENDTTSSPVSWLPTASIPERAAPNQQWASSSTARSRQFLVIGFLGLSGCILAGLLFAFFLKWYGQSSQLTANPADENATKQVESQTNEPISPTEANTANNDVVTSPTDSQTLESLPTEPLPTIPTTQLDLGSTDTPTEKEPEQPLSAVVQPELNSADATVSVPPLEVPPQIAELLKVIGEPEKVTDPPKLIIPDKPAVTETVINTGLNSTLLAPIAKLKETASERQLRALRFQKKNLSEVVSLWNTVVGLPAVIDPKGLAAADYDLTTTFDIESDNTTAAVAIDKMASTLGLRAEAIENRFWHLQAAPADETKLPWKVPVDDLLKTAEDQNWLVETIEALFPGSSPGLAYAEGNLVGNVQTLDRLTWFSIVRLLENWRLNEGMSLKLSGYRPENLRLPFVVQSQIPELKLELNQVTSASRPLAALIKSVASEAGLECWVDWPALEYLPVRLSHPTRAISPQTLRACVTQGRTLQSILNELEFELGITCLLVNEKTLWLTSHYAYRRVPEVFIFPSQGKKLDTFWSQYLRPLTPIDASGISQVILRQTPDGKYVIAKCCWPTLQFE